jgi:undecaprenyl-diphosphatase
MENMFGALRVYDERVLHFLVLRRGRVLDRLMRFATRCGDTPVAIGIAVALLIGSATHEVGALAAFALATSHIGVQLLKRTVNRARPQLPQGVSALMQAPDRFSFPSGHSAAALSLALAVLPVVPWPVGAALLSLAMLTGISRVYLGVHYPGDVLAGWTLALSGWLTGIWVL